MFLKTYQSGIYSAFLLLLIGCRNSADELAPFHHKEDWLAEKAKNVVINYSDSGIVRVEVIAPEMIRKWEQTDYKTTLPKGVTAHFFDSEGNRSSTLTGNYATVDSKSGIMNVKGDVQVINSNGDTLLTENLILDQSKDRLATNGPVTVRRSTQIIMADGLESNRDFTKYTFTKVRGTLSVKGNL
ncbi:MAG: LPS export ABC transporter periplasmic protein LptC [Bacteroidia bacterium]|jgi:LPS export ABC transporter protein LptC